eukprot:PLAT8363.1.p2 GENE.PLAT8363.1~~PLAT8363.1.p2  ORF type:complete len:616 (+),score=271.35 PLAT8363.1:10-1857(+)
MDQENQLDTLSLDVRRRVWEREFQHLNSLTYHILEFGAETAFFTERKARSIVAGVKASNPLRTRFVRHHFRQLRRLLRKWRLKAKAARASAVTSAVEAAEVADVADEPEHETLEELEGQEGVQTITKIQYLEMELARLKEAMLSMQAASAGAAPAAAAAADSLPAASSDAAADSDPAEDAEGEEVDGGRWPLLRPGIALPPAPYSDDVAPPPMPPPLPVPEEDEEDEDAGSSAKVPELKVYCRRLDVGSTKPLTLAEMVRMGSAIKLRPVEGPRSPGGTPMRDSKASSRPRAGSTNTADIISLALQRKFSAARPRESMSPEKDYGEWDDGRLSDASCGGLFQAWSQAFQAESAATAAPAAAEVEDAVEAVEDVHSAGSDSTASGRAAPAGLLADIRAFKQDKLAAVTEAKQEAEKPTDMLAAIRSFDRSKLAPKKAPTDKQPAAAPAAAPAGRSALLAAIEGGAHKLRPTPAAKAASSLPTPSAAKMSLLDEIRSGSARLSPASRPAAASRPAGKKMSMLEEIRAGSARLSPAKKPVSKAAASPASSQQGELAAAIARFRAGSFNKASPAPASPTAAKDAAAAPSSPAEMLGGRRLRHVHRPSLDKENASALPSM